MITNKWIKIVEYINKKPIGDLIFRKDLILFEKHGIYDKNTVIDNYRNWLQKCGYLSQITLGTYKVLKHIRPELSSGDVKKMAYSQEHRINNDRSEKLKEIFEDGLGLLERTC